MNVEKRIRNGIKFFRVFVKADKYDSEPFRKYWPKFLEMVEEYMNGQPKQPDKQEELMDAAKGVFKGNIEKETD